MLRHRLDSDIILTAVFFLFQDESFTEILNNNRHVTLIRKSKKGIAQSESQTEQEIDKTTETETMGIVTNEEEKHQDGDHDTPTTQPYMPTPTRRGEVRRPIKSDDSITLDPYNLWYVSDESFLEMEKSCESPRENNRKSIRSEVNDTTLLYDVQEPSFFIHDSDSDDLLDESVFERPSMSMMSPMKQVAMRRPSTILEESTIRSINSSDERSGSSLSLKQSLNVEGESSNKSSKSHSYRPSDANVFPSRSRIGFYDNLDATSSTIERQPLVKNSTGGKENLVKSDGSAHKSRSYRPSLLNVFPTRSRVGFFETLEISSSSSSTDQSSITSTKENSINLMKFENLDKESPPTSRPASERIRSNSISLIQFDTSIDESSFSNLSVDQTQANSSMSDNEQPDQFNDTLEAVDYYMKRGKKILDKTGASTTLLTPCVTASPKNRNNSLLKQTLARRHLMSMTGDNKLGNKKLF